MTYVAEVKASLWTRTQSPMPILMGADDSLFTDLAVGRLDLGVDVDGAPHPPGVVPSTRISPQESSASSVSKPTSSS